MKKTMDSEQSTDDCQSCCDDVPDCKECETYKHMTFFERHGYWLQIMVTLIAMATILFSLGSCTGQSKAYSEMGEFYGIDSKEEFLALFNNGGPNVSQRITISLEETVTVPNSSVEIGLTRSMSGGIEANALTSDGQSQRIAHIWPEQQFVSNYGYLWEEALYVCLVSYLKEEATFNVIQLNGEIVELSTWP